MRSSYLGLNCKGGKVLSRILPVEAETASVLCSSVVVPECSI